MHYTLNSENDNLNFEALCLTFVNFSRLTAIKVLPYVSRAVLHEIYTPLRLTMDEMPNATTACEAVVSFLRALEPSTSYMGSSPLLRQNTPRIVEYFFND